MSGGKTWLSNSTAGGRALPVTTASLPKQNGAVYHLLRLGQNKFRNHKLSFSTFSFKYTIYLRPYVLTYLLTSLLTYLLTYLIIYLLPYLLTYLFIYLLTFLLTYLFT